MPYIQTRSGLTARVVRVARCAVPGSHLRTAAHWEAVATASGRDALPRIYGTDIKERSGRHHERTTFSAASEVGSWLRQQEPVPLLARRGQCTVMTTALLHSAWLNSDAQPRKGALCKPTLISDRITITMYPVHNIVCVYYVNCTVYHQ